MESIFVKFAQYPSLETERLLLRPVTMDDAEAMFEYASDRENTRYTFPTNHSLIGFRCQSLIPIVFIDNIADSALLKDSINLVQINGTDKLTIAF